MDDYKSPGSTYDRDFLLSHIPEKRIAIKIFLIFIYQATVDVFFQKLSHKSIKYCCINKPKYCCNGHID